MGDALRLRAPHPLVGHRPVIDPPRADALAVVLVLPLPGELAHARNLATFGSAITPTTAVACHAHAPPRRTSHSKPHALDVDAELASTTSCRASSYSSSALRGSPALRGWRTRCRRRGRRARASPRRGARAWLPALGHLSDRLFLGRLARAHLGRFGGPDLHVDQEVAHVALKVRLDADGSPATTQPRSSAASGGVAAVPTGSAVHLAPAPRNAQKPASQRAFGFSKRRGRDSNPRYSYPHNGFRDRPVRPLRHLSSVAAAEDTNAYRYRLSRATAATEITAAMIRLNVACRMPGLSAAGAANCTGRR